MKTIFGDKNDDPEVITDENSEYTWEPGESLERFEDPDFQENIKKLL